MRYLTGCRSKFISNDAYNLMHLEFVFYKLNEPVLVRINIVKQLVFLLLNIFCLFFKVSLIKPIQKRIHQHVLQLED